MLNTFCLKKTGHLPNEILKTDHCVCEAATAGRANKAHSCLASPALGKLLLRLRAEKNLQPTKEVPPEFAENLPTNPLADFKVPELPDNYIIW